MRRGEVIGLQWTDVDRSARTISVGRSITRVDKVVILTPKTEKGVRSVAIDDDTLQALREHRSESNRWAELCGEGWNPEGWVFPGRSGSHVHPNTLSYSWCWIRMHLVADLGLPPITIHGMRHTHASLMIEQGKSPRVVQERLGHEHVAFTLARYVHTSDEQHSDAADSFAVQLKRKGSTRP